MMGGGWWVVESFLIHSASELDTVAEALGMLLSDGDNDNNLVAFKNSVRID